MNNYFKAFDESYIPLKVEEGIAMFTEEIYDSFVDNYYSTLQFDKDFSRISQGILEEDYKLLKEAAHSIKGGLGYLLPIDVDKVSNELQIFILERIDGKDTKAKFPFTEEDKKKVYQNSIYILTEMIALQRYFTQKYPLFENKYVYETAKKLIDSCYSKFFSRFKQPTSSKEQMEKSEKQLNKSSTNQTDKENIKVSKSQNGQNDTSQKIKDQSIKQENSDKDSKKEALQQEDKLPTNGSILENNKNNSIIENSKSKDATEIQPGTNTKNASTKKEDGVGVNDITIEKQEKIQPCCNTCNIF